MEDERLDDIELIDSDDSWKRYKIYVIVGIRRLRTEVDVIRKKIDDDIITKLNYLENQNSK